MWTGQLTKPQLQLTFNAIILTCSLEIIMTQSCSFFSTLIFFDFGVFTLALCWMRRFLVCGQEVVFGEEVAEGHRCVRGDCLL